MTRTRPLRRILLIGVVLAATLGFSGAVRLSFAQCPEAPPFALLPPNWTCPVLPKCGTQYGVCRWPYAASGGQPCQCQAANGAWIPGVITVGSPGR